MGVQEAGDAIPSTTDALIDLARLAAPLCVSQIAWGLINSMCVIAAGAVGVAQLGGVAMGFSLMNSTGYAFGSGLCGALETLLSHSYGRDPQSRKYGTHTQRMILLLLCISIPLAALLCYIDVLLGAAGMDASIVFYTTSFVRITVFGLVPMLLLEVQRRYLTCQCVSTPVSVSILVAAAALPLFLAAYRASMFNMMGLAAIGWAWVSTLCLVNVCLFGYTVATGMYKQSWGGWNRDALRRWGPMLHLGVPSLLMTVAEWGCMEMMSLVGGFNPPIEYAAFSISVQLVVFAWNSCAGFYTAVSVLIGNSIGAGRNLAARKYAITSMAMVFCITLINVATMWCLGRRIPMLFTSSEDVIVQYERLLPFVLCWHMVDTFQSNMLGILRGTGMLQRGAQIINMAMNLCGLPLGVVLCFKVGMGAGGLWLGMFLGVFVVGVPQYLWSMAYTDWHAIKAHGEDPAVLLEEDNHDTLPVAQSIQIQEFPQEQSTRAAS